MRTHQTRFWKAGVIANARTAGVVDANRATPPPPHRAAKDRKITGDFWAGGRGLPSRHDNPRAGGTGPVPANLICGEISSFIIPGTNTCVDANQIVANQIGAAR